MDSTCISHATCLLSVYIMSFAYISYLSLYFSWLVTFYVTFMLFVFLPSIKEYFSNDEENSYYNTLYYCSCGTNFKKRSFL